MEDGTIQHFQISGHDKYTDFNPWHARLGYAKLHPPIEIPHKKLSLRPEERTLKVDLLVPHYIASIALHGTFRNNTKYFSTAFTMEFSTNSYSWSYGKTNVSSTFELTFNQYFKIKH